MLRWLTAGESHGPALVAVLEGLPAQVQVTSADVVDALARRRLGYGRGARMKFEQDEVEFLGGLRHGRTLGSPVAIRVGNTEWPKWDKVMAADPVDPAELETLARNAALTRPRPGHADLVGMQKYGFDEARPVLERASARETAARVALGAVAAAFLRQAVGAQVVSHVVRIGTAAAPAGSVPEPGDVERLDADPVRCLDPDAS
jgi:chorismate synthase